MRAASPPVYYSLVIVDRKSDAVVAVGTVFLERKFLRGLGVVGHIEDIAVDKSQQGKKLGLRVIQALTGISERQGAYKTILNCSTANVPFYEKCGYVQKENEMVRCMAFDPCLSLIYLHRRPSTLPSAQTPLGSKGQLRTLSVNVRRTCTILINRLLSGLEFRFTIGRTPVHAVTVVLMKP
jgi:hypothetical protein